MDVSGVSGLTKVGRGAGGVLYRGTLTASDRDVAVKVLATRLIDEGSRDRFGEDVDVLRVLGDHPQILGPVGSGVDPDGRAHLIRPWMSSGSLAALIQREGAMPVEQVLPLGIALSGALESTHRSGVLHGNLCPENLMVNEEGEVLMADVGLAGLAGRHPAHGVADDIANLAACLVAVLKGETHPSRDLYGREGTARLRALGVGVGVAQVLVSAMAANPDDRPGSANILGRMLSQAGRDLGLPAIPMRILRMTTTRDLEAEADPDVEEKDPQERAPNPPSALPSGGPPPTSFDPDPRDQRGRVRRPAGRTLKWVGAGVLAVVALLGGAVLLRSGVTSQVGEETFDTVLDSRVGDAPPAVRPSEQPSSETAPVLEVTESSGTPPPDTGAPRTSLPGTRPNSPPQTEAPPPEAPPDAPPSAAPPPDVVSPDGTPASSGPEPVNGYPQPTVGEWTVVLASVRQDAAGVEALRAVVDDASSIAASIGVEATRVGVVDTNTVQFDGASVSQPGFYAVVVDGYAEDSAAAAVRSWANAGFDAAYVRGPLTAL